MLSEQQERTLNEIRDLLRQLISRDQNTNEINHMSDFEELKNVLKSHDWSYAVDPDLVCDESRPEEVLSRAKAIMDYLIDDPLQETKFLDFGCGKGHTILNAVRYGASVANGYDVAEADEWKLFKLDPEKSILTTHWAEIYRKRPYDHILIYDVLDHVSGDPMDSLRKIRSVCDESTQLHVRMHPWTSRTGSHHFKKLNKAFIHIIFTPEELSLLGLTEEMPIIKTIHPQITYEKWFKETGFRIIDKNVISDPVEEIFEKHPLIARRIKQHWSESHERGLATGESFPKAQLRISFVDYLLQIK